MPGNPEKSSIGDMVQHSRPTVGVTAAICAKINYRKHQTLSGRERLNNFDVITRGQNRSAKPKNQAIRASTAWDLVVGIPRPLHQLMA
jgi:hypothetical protein